MSNLSDAIKKAIEADSTEPTAQSKVEPKEDTKVEPKEEPKEDSKEEPKVEPKEDSKEEPKEDSKEDSKEDPKEDDDDEDAPVEDRLTIWKHRSRQWEKRAKSLRNEVESLNKDREELDELREFKKEYELNSTRMKIAEETGLPVSIVNTLGGDEQQIRAAAAAIKAALPEQTNTSEPTGSVKKPVPSFGTGKTEKRSLAESIAAQL